jgi:hypothetical protein
MAESSDDTLVNAAAGSSIMSVSTTSTDSDMGAGDFTSPEEELLYYARNGCAMDIEKLLHSCSHNSISVDINCKGNECMHFIILCAIEVQVEKNPLCVVSSSCVRSRNNKKKSSVCCTCCKCHCV